MTGLDAFRWVIVVAVLAGALWIGIGLMGEAYGSGPPHYGGTANMDKWTSPWPAVLLLAGLATIVVAFVTPWRSLGRGRRKEWR
ncbi:hypothetical protein GTW25_16180 [Aliihoeflea aestuarii]|jgi:multisubunit Na+/H+ antiporter MnhC subunit|uniref:hypothetical protein n=1 Tax=Aliihoeflea aestuarii TaxID=453840 RepID=UPI002094A9FB|nr:hypothetical protein [Aliihoeflea aestuarii]MCO6392564.1 hypothetical protein [Aliihoeflea aestuarii]